MRHRGSLRTIAVLLVAASAAGCAGASDPPAATPSTSPSSTATSAPTTPPPSPSASPAAATLAAAGLGPYRVGTKLTALTGQVSGAETAPGCPDHTVARGSATYGQPALVFYRGTLLYLRVESTQTRTTGGARVGMSMAEVQQRHPDGMQYAYGGGKVVWLEPDGVNALVFVVGGGAVEAIEAGPAETMEFRFTEGEGC